MAKELTRDEAFALLKEYNKEPFHIQHGETVECVMRYFAQELGYGDDVEFWISNFIPNSTVLNARKS